MRPADRAVIARHLAWLRLRGLSASTIHTRAAVMGRVSASLPRPLLAASTAELAAWRAGLRAAPSTVSVYVSHVRAFYRWATAEGLLRGSPAAALPAPRRARMLPRPIGEAPLLAALSAAPPRVRPWLVLAGWAGLRAVEIALLRRENVLDAREPPVLLIAAAATKGSRERLVPMSPFVLGELQPCLVRRGWLFPRADGRPGPNSPTRISHVANDHLHSCGLTETLHQLRHRFGTVAYQASGDLRMVQELLGHASPSTTAGYAAYSQSAAAAAVEQIPAPGRLQAIS